MLELYKGDVPEQWRDWAPTGKALEQAVVAIETNNATAAFFRSRKPTPQGGGSKAVNQPSQRTQATGDVVPPEEAGMVSTTRLATALRKQLKRHGLKEAKGDSGAA